MCRQLLPINKNISCIQDADLPEELPTGHAGQTPARMEKGGSGAPCRASLRREATTRTLRGGVKPQLRQGASRRCSKSMRSRDRLLPDRRKLLRNPRGFQAGFVPETAYLSVGKGRRQVSAAIGRRPEAASADARISVDILSQCARAIAPLAAVSACSCVSQEAKSSPRVGLDRQRLPAILVPAGRMRFTACLRPPRRFGPGRQSTGKAS